MEGEKMVRKSKVGSTGRFGARYGRKAKRTVRDIEDKMHAKHICPRCDRPGVKRTHAGIWKCKKCGKIEYRRYLQEYVKNVVTYLLVEHTFQQHQWEKLQNVISNVSLEENNYVQMH